MLPALEKRTVDAVSDTPSGTGKGAGNERYCDTHHISGSGPARLHSSHISTTAMADLYYGAVPQPSLPLPQRLRAAVRECVVIDCETTGLEPASDRVIEVAAIHVVDGEVRETVATMVDPGVPLPHVITELTGIADHELSGRPAMDEVLDGILRMIGGRTVVGHNVAFDLAFLNGELRRTTSDGTGMPPHSTLCTAECARELIPRSEVGRYRLATLADTLALPHRPAHRASEDVLATVDLLRYLEQRAAS